MKSLQKALLLLCYIAASNATIADETDTTTPVRVFIFAGQSNMVGSDSKVQDIQNFPPFIGLDQPQSKVKFSYCIGRENKMRSNGWVDLAPVDNVVGPELSFAREVSQHIDAPIAIIKCAAGGTHLGGDWNPDDPQGFKMYPLALELVRESLHALEEQGIPYQVEGFMWHQGENDMFNEAYRLNYGPNLVNFISSWRRDLNLPELKFYIGELCTKTIWGMDLRPWMYDISIGQKEVCAVDRLADYIPTSHVGVEIGGGVGLHYHYGTLGQLEHGVNYAQAYLKTIGEWIPATRPFKEWPYPAGEKIQLYILAGHRNMEGERCFTQDLEKLNRQDLLNDQPQIAYRYQFGGGVKQSDEWEPLGPAGYYDTFGPEVSFGAAINQTVGCSQRIAIAKFTHSGSQMNDWTPEGSVAKSRHIYPKFIQFIRESVQSLEAKGHEVEVRAVLYHIGENEMSMPPYRQKAAQWVESMIQQSREDLEMPELKWLLSQQPPTDHENVNRIDVGADFKNLTENDPLTEWLYLNELPQQPKQLVLNTEGIIYLGEKLAGWVLKSR